MIVVKCENILHYYRYAGVVKLVDAWDLNSLALMACGFDSRLRYQKYLYKEVIVMKHLIR